MKRKIGWVMILLSALLFYYYVDGPKAGPNCIVIGVPLALAGGVLVLRNKKEEVVPLKQSDLHNIDEIVATVTDEQLELFVNEHAKRKGALVVKEAYPIQPEQPERKLLEGIQFNDKSKSIQSL